MSCEVPQLWRRRVQRLRQRTPVAGPRDRDCLAAKGARVVAHGAVALLALCEDVCFKNGCINSLPLKR